jgi:predicted nuclease of predicted toxin-antitoxin system
MPAVLLDEGLPVRTAQWLRGNGIDAVHAREVGLTSAADEQILAAGRSARRVCFTLDHDFHMILAESGATGPSVVLLRMEQSDYVHIGQVIARVLRDFGQQLETGVAATVTVRGIRLRGLPLK